MGVRRSVLIVACVVASGAATAGAGVGSFELELLSDTTELTPENPSASLVIRAGIFGNPGAMGVGAFQGDVTASEASLSGPTTVPPFVVPVGGQPPLNFGDELSGIDIVRPGIFDIDPPPAVGQGVFADIYTFEFTATDFGTAREVTIDVTGAGARIVDWQFTAGGLIPILGPLSGQTTASITLDVVPAPGVVGVLGLGGLVAARRRRG